MNFFELINANEILIRLVSFGGIFLIMALWELAAPCRQLSLARPARWFSNLGLVALDTLAVRLIFPVAAAGFTVWVSSQGWGLLNNVALTGWVELVIALIVLDLIIYWQHWFFHYSPFFWNYHKVHHADLDYDVTTGARFHPMEIIFSLCIKFVAILILGPSATAVILFEVILNGTAMFNHSNITLPPKLDRVLRWIVVTPDMHRVHHSVEDDEHNSNFGFNLPWWDRLFRTYRQRTRAGNQGMIIGLNTYRNPDQSDKLWGMLLIPFAGEPQPNSTREAE